LAFSGRTAETFNKLFSFIDDVILDPFMGSGAAVISS
jgi:DNA modification methylase